MLLSLSWKEYVIKSVMERACCFNVLYTVYKSERRPKKELVLGVTREIYLLERVLQVGDAIYHICILCIYIYYDICILSLHYKYLRIKNTIQSNKLFQFWFSFLSHRWFSTSPSWSWWLPGVMEPSCDTPATWSARQARGGVLKYNHWSIPCLRIRASAK
jgi:hypothetical protein